MSKAIYKTHDVRVGYVICEVDDHYSLAELLADVCVKSYKQMKTYLKRRKLQQTYGKTLSFAQMDDVLCVHDNWIFDRNTQ